MWSRVKISDALTRGQKLTGTWGENARQRSGKMLINDEYSLRFISFTFYFTIDFHVCAG